MVKIYVDAGHGGSDPGAQANGIKEKDITLKIAKKIQSYLGEYKGVSVKMSRTNDSFPSLNDRTNEANSWGADLFLSIHINSGGGAGYEDYIYTTLSDSSQTAKIRDAIHAAVLKQNGLSDRGKKKDNLHVLRESQMDAILTENGFIDNASDAAKMKDQSWINKVARGHVNGIANYYGLKKDSGGSDGGSSKTKYVEVLASSLWVYDKPDWNARYKTVSKGEVFTVKKTITVDGSKMHQLKSGLYITDNRDYVRVYTK